MPRRKQIWKWHKKPGGLRAARRMSIRSYFRAFLGFTQVEIVVIVAIIGVMSVIAAPELSGMLDAAKMQQAAVELRGAFQETQRSSIRENKSCETTVVIASSLSRGSKVTGSCLVTGDRSLPEGVGLVTNLEPSSSSSSSSSGSGSASTGSTVASDSTENKASSPLPPLTQVHRANLGASALCYIQDACGENSNTPLPESFAFQIGFGKLGAANFKVLGSQLSNSSDNSAKFVSFRPKNPEKKKACLVVSRSLGLTRIGKYEGPLSPRQLNTQGTCRVASWSNQ